MFGDRQTAINLMERARTLDLGDEAMDLVDTCVSTDSLERTGTNLVDLKKVRLGLETMISGADEPATGLLVEEES